MSKLFEIINSLNDGNVEEIKQLLISEAKALEKNNSTLYKRAKKAEGYEYDQDKKAWVKKEVKKEPEKEPEAKGAVKPNEPDYAKIAFLEQRGLTHTEDQKLVQDEAARLNLPLTDILSMEHIKTRLATAKDQREAAAGMPKGKGRGSGNTAQDVDYWLKKGETPSDLELAEKVIDARIKKEEQGSKFSEELFTG